MAITLEHIKERLSYSYVTAVVAKAGAVISKPEPDYGVDATIHLVNVTALKITHTKPQSPPRKAKLCGFVPSCEIFIARGDRQSWAAALKNSHESGYVSVTSDCFSLFMAIGSQVYTHALH